MKEKLPRLVWWFAISSGVIMAITGLAKVASALGSAGILVHDDPIVGLSFRHLMLVAGVAEVAIACICFVPRLSTVAVKITAYFGSLLVVYRLGLFWMGWHRPCPCLGNLTDALHIQPEAADTIMKFILGYLLIGSYSLMYLTWQKTGVHRSPAAVIGNPISGH